MPLARVGSAPVDLYYELHGAEDAAAAPMVLPVVLIMGLGTDLHGWERQMSALTTARRVLVLDNRGVGRSAKPDGSYTTAGLADDVIGVLDAAGIDAAHVAGLSLGGMIAQELALRHPARVRSLALVSTYARADAGARETAAQGATVGRLDLRALGEMLAPGRQGGAASGAGAVGLDVRAMMAFLMQMVFTPKFLSEERQFLKQFYERSLSYGFSPRGFAGQVAAALAHDTTARLGEIAAPTIVITGTKDLLIPARHSRLLAGAIPGARLVEIEGGSHGMNFERAADLNGVLNAWLAERDGAAVSSS